MINTTTFYSLILNDDGDAAVRQLTALAELGGGWGPAPGDTVVFDPYMPSWTVAEVKAIDLPPDGCDTDDPTEPRHPDCDRVFEYQQSLVRFGSMTFVKPLADGSFAPRSNIDDMLSVYIEEVGHSWQEYCYETEGRCAGERTMLTTWGAGRRLASGREYQVKMYILSLDGTWLTLSDGERTELKTAICGGYANPKYSEVPAYNAPPAWPNPQGWPTTKPTVEEFQKFCNEPGS